MAVWGVACSKDDSRIHYVACWSAEQAASGGHSEWRKGFHTVIYFIRDLVVWPKDLSAPLLAC